jgi:Flp pilus assembly protein CpaB
VVRVPTRLDGSAWWREVRRAIGWHRRLLAAALAALAVTLAISAARPEPAPTVAVLVAAHDIAAGVVVVADDVRAVQRPADTLPVGALTAPASAVDRTVAVPVRSGEVLTDVRFTGGDLLAGFGPDVVAAPVRVLDGGIVELLRPGDRIDVLATAVSNGVAGPTRVVAADVPVVAIPDGGGTDSYSQGGLVLVATTEDQARLLAAAAVDSQLSIVVRGA